MHVQPFYLLVLTLTLFVSGCYLGWLVQARRTRDEVGTVARGLKGRVHDHMKEFDKMQENMQQVIDSFDKMDRELATLIVQQNERLEDLRAAFNEHVGAPREGASKAAIQLRQSLADAPTEIRKRVDAIENMNLEAELALWETHMLRVQGEKRSELERQSTVIEELTRRLENLKTVPDLRLEEPDANADGPWNGTINSQHKSKRRLGDTQMLENLPPAVPHEENGEAVGESSGDSSESSTEEDV